MKIAVLLTCFNRREKTLKCLENLFAQTSLDEIEFEVFLTDDNSSDGTLKAVEERFPSVNLLKGSGTLFWAGGMRNSWTAARNSEVDFDYYLLLNDDTNIFEDTLSKVVKSNLAMKNKNQKANVTIGTTTDSEDGKFTYGGFKLYSPNKLKHVLVNSVSQEMECDFGCANIMLVPKEVVDKIGILSDRFVHGIADFDYTLRAKKANFDVWVAPGVIGNCPYDHTKSWKSMDSSLSDRIKYLYSPKGLEYKEYMYFLKTHFPSEVPSMFVKFWVKTLFPVVYDKFKVERKEVQIEQKD